MVDQRRVRRGRATGSPTPPPAPRGRRRRRPGSAPGPSTRTTRCPPRAGRHRRARRRAAGSTPAGGWSPAPAAPGGCRRWSRRRARRPRARGCARAGAGAGSPTPTPGRGPAGRGVTPSGTRATPQPFLRRQTVSTSRARTAAPAAASRSTRSAPSGVWVAACSRVRASAVPRRAISLGACAPQRRLTVPARRAAGDLDLGLDGRRVARLVAHVVSLAGGPGRGSRQAVPYCDLVSTRRLVWTRDHFFGPILPHRRRLGAAAAVAGLALTACVGRPGAGRPRATGAGWSPPSRRSRASSANIGGDRVEDHRHRPRGHELAHLRAEAERRRGALAGRRRLRQRAQARGPDRRARAEEPQGRRRDRRARHATIAETQYIYDFSFPRTDGKPNPHLWTDPLLGAQLRARSSATTLSRARPGERAPTTPRTTRGSRRSIGELDRAMRRAFATIPADRPQAAHLPRRLRLLRQGLRLEGASARSRSPTSRTRRPRRSPR